MRTVLWIATVMFLFAASPASGRSDDLMVLARPGPWPVADRLVPFRERLWFATAVKGVNHNSADIWSLNPVDGQVRFERYLFSQDAGIPTVHRGLLYWPHEDMRVGTGDGVASVTNGADWRDFAIPVSGTMMHTHAMIPWQGDLIAALAGWNGALARSTNGGVTWQTMANDPPGDGAFHRYNGLATLGDRLFVRHWRRSGVVLAEFRDGRVGAIDGWPSGVDLSEPVAFQGHLYAIVTRRSGDTELWRVGSGRTERVPFRPAKLTMRALAGDGQSLWMAATSRSGGQLWHSRDGRTFEQGPLLDGGDPVSMTALGPGRIYVGGKGHDGQAIVWGPKPDAAFRRLSEEQPNLPAGPACPDRSGNGSLIRAELVNALADLGNYQGHGSGLRRKFSAALTQNPPADLFSGLLKLPLPDMAVEVYGGQFRVPAAEIARWRLINALAANCETVPLQLLAGTWLRQPNGPQKWFDPLLAAMRAIQHLNQNDQATIDALIARLDQPGDPEWLQSQLTGTLTAITGKRLAYDRSAWRRWWRMARKDWPRQGTGG